VPFLEAYLIILYSFTYSELKLATLQSVYDVTHLSSTRVTILR